MKKDYTNFLKDDILFIEPTEEREPNGSIIWKCQCQKCNSILMISTKQLRNKNLVCDNCFKNSEVGKIYGKLKVIKFVDLKEKQGNHWLCECECGKETIVKTSSLKSGKTKSCGCLQQEKAKQQALKLEGKKIGKWTVLYRVQNKKGQPSKWHCRCSCGTERDVVGTELNNFRSLSCGCMRQSHGEYKIAQLLSKNNIDFETEKKFSTCRFPNSDFPARFDFYINNSYLIEYDGQQHFDKKYERKNGEFEKTLIRDKIKNEWCKNNNIHLIRIPYWHLNDLSIKDLLLESSNFIIV